VGKKKEGLHCFVCKELRKKKLSQSVHFADLMNCEFDRRDLVSLILCGGVGVWYLYEKRKGLLAGLSSVATLGFEEQSSVVENENT
jgi:hypothetical protein